VESLRFQSPITPTPRIMNFIRRIFDSWPATVLLWFAVCYIISEVMLGFFFP
jgi:hypothetical protein